MTFGFSNPCFWASGFETKSLTMWWWIHGRPESNCSCLCNQQPGLVRTVLTVSKLPIQNKSFQHNNLLSRLEKQHFRKLRPDPHNGRVWVRAVNDGTGFRMACLVYVALARTWTTPGQSFFLVSRPSFSALCGPELGQTSFCYVGSFSRVRSRMRRWTTRPVKKTVCMEHLFI